jgi:putative Mg2+ transporter-C (MgtC) family protein
VLSAGHTTLAAFPSGQGLKQVGELGLAFGLSALIGLEREWRQKSAGLRTHTLVGVGAALFMLVSKYGFGDVLVGDRIVLDPSRIAAQVVSGIGFIGGGLIFVRQDAVRGLTTAAGVWLVAAVGMAAGAGLPVLAVASTLLYLLVTMTYPLVAGRLLGTSLAPAPLRITYLDGQGVLRDVLSRVTNAGFAVSDLNFQRHDEDAVVVDVRVTGRGALTGLVGELGALDGVLVVHTAETDPD